MAACCTMGHASQLRCTPPAFHLEDITHRKRPTVCLHQQDPKSSLKITPQTIHLEGSARDMIAVATRASRVPQRPPLLARGLVPGHSKFKMI